MGEQFRLLFFAIYSQSMPLSCKNYPVDQTVIYQQPQFNEECKPIKKKLIFFFKIIIYLSVKYSKTAPLH